MSLSFCVCLRSKSVWVLGSVCWHAVPHVSSWCARVLESQAPAKYLFCWALGSTVGRAASTVYSVFDSLSMASGSVNFLRVNR